ncbi:spermatogenesis-associated protein 4 [Ascaphus truei]|uniref:spermatogenesis-associated protein 4 n=1 Tax=Ascaphus truei TaxID=8439 RepID=UPI003F5AC1BE
MTCYAEAPRQTGVPREVLRWLQSLDLSFSPKHFRRDITNGYITAEIFYWYFPEDIKLHSYDNGTSLATKLSNWSQLEKFTLKEFGNLSGYKLNIGKSEALNLTLSEEEVKPLKINVNYKWKENHLKYKDIAVWIHVSGYEGNSVGVHPLKIIRRSSLAGGTAPSGDTKIKPVLERFNLKPSLGELAIRRLPSSEQSDSEDSLSNGKSSSSNSSVADIRSKTNVYFKEIKVKQADKSYVSTSSTASLSTLNAP